MKKNFTKKCDFNVYKTNKKNQPRGIDGTRIQGCYLKAPSTFYKKKTVLITN